MGLERRMVEKVVIEEVDVDICDGCLLAREGGDAGWTYLTFANRDREPVFMCPACTAKAQAAVGWK